MLPSYTLLMILLINEIQMLQYQSKRCVDYTGICVEKYNLVKF